MNKDLLFAASVSVLAHAGLIWIGQAFRHPTLGSATAPTEKPIVFTLPAPEPEPPDIVYDDHAEPPAPPQGPSDPSLPDQVSTLPSPFVAPVDPRPPSIDISP